MGFIKNTLRPVVEIPPQKDWEPILNEWGKRIIEQIVKIPFPTQESKVLRVEVPVPVIQEVIKEVKVEVPVIVEKVVEKEIVREISVKIHGNRFYKAWLALRGRIE